MKFAFFVLAIFSCFIPDRVEAQQSAEATPYHEYVMEGRPEAPIHLVLFYNPIGEDSLSFMENIVAPLIRDYVQTGKANITYYEVLNHNIATLAFMRCVPQEKYVSVIGSVFSARKKLRTQNNLRPTLLGIAKENGIDWTPLTTCRNNPDTQEKIRQSYKDEMRAYSLYYLPDLLVMGTPYRFTRLVTYENVDAALRTLLPSSKN